MSNRVKMNNDSAIKMKRGEGKKRLSESKLDQKKFFIQNSNINERMNDNKINSVSVNERVPSLSPKNKDKKGVVSSNQLKDDLNNELDNNNMEINKNKRKENILHSSFSFYKENKIKVLYKSKQKYISIILLISSLILFFLSIFDLMRNFNKKRNYLLCNSIIFAVEMLFSGLIILFHIIYYFVNLNNNYIFFLIMSIIILVFNFIYIGIYIKKKVNLIEIILIMIFNLLLVIINLAYLFMSYYLGKENTKMQQNIEDIMNFSLRNEKIGKNDFGEKKKENKIKGMELVEEVN